MGIGIYELLICFGALLFLLLVIAAVIAVVWALTQRDRPDGEE